MKIHFFYGVIYKPVDKIRVGWKPVQFDNVTEPEDCVYFVATPLWSNKNALAEIRVAFVDA